MYSLLLVDLYMFNSFTLTWKISGFVPSNSLSWHVWSVDHYLNLPVWSVDHYPNLPVWTVDPYMFGQLTPVDQLIPICLINWPLFISWSLTVWSVDPYLFDKLIIPFLISWSLPVFSVDLYLFDQMILTCVIIWSLHAG